MIPTALTLATEVVWGRPDAPETVVFAVAAVVAVGAALAVVTLRNVVHGALMLVLHFLAVAVLYLTLQSSFLAIIQVLVYAGAIMVLFLFVIMLLGVDRDDLLATGGVRTTVAASAVGLLVAGALVAVLVGPTTAPASVCGSGATPTGTDIACVGLDAALEDDASGVAALGRRLFTRHVLPFELAGLLLTVATIGAVILARRHDEVDDAPDDADVVAATAGDVAEGA